MVVELRNVTRQAEDLLCMGSESDEEQPQGNYEREGMWSLYSIVPLYVCIYVRTIRQGKDAIGKG